ncbi:MAG: hypothetical protein LBR91_03445 [Puniceicoccales bacterium]|jgi:hypothetical protein|nr:hypothetical protein [Puniceicoccales bacterium]
MEKIADDLGLSVSHSSPCFGDFGRLGSLFGGCVLCGKLRGKQLAIYTTRFPGCACFPLRIVVRADVQASDGLNITIKAMPLFVSFHRVFDGNITTTGYATFDRKLLLSTNDRPLAEAILRYEEIRDQMCYILEKRRHNGVLIIGTSSIAYHEPFKLITRATRNRIKDAATLVCDIADVINMGRLKKINFNFL